MFNQRAQEQLESPVDGRRIRDLQHAKQRFHSTQKPLGRFVLFLDAVLATAHEISVRRAGRAPAVHAAACLDFVTEERVLALAMMADAGDEVSSVVRFFDTDGYDLAAAPATIQDFLGRIDCLFVQRACLEPESRSYTSHALKLLSRQRLLQGTAGLRALGGPGTLPPATIGRCLSRMAAWVRLAGSSVRAEFPAWELVMAFGAFDLRTLPSDTFLRESLRRMSKVYGPNEDHLRQEFLDHQAFARRAWEQSAASNSGAAPAFYSAWSSSVRRTRSKKATRRAHPSDNLLALLLRYGAFCGASTSSVERVFAKVDKVIGADRATMSDIHIANELKLQLDVTSAGEEADLVKAARGIWVECFGLSRLSGPSRKRRWISGPRSKVASEEGRPGTERAWLQAKRAGTALVTQRLQRSREEAEAAARRLSTPAWTPSHAKALGLDTLLF